MMPAKHWRSQPKYLSGEYLGGQNVWFSASNSILFGILPLKAQND